MDDNIIFTRTMQYVIDQGAQDVVINVFLPVLERDDYKCAFNIVGLPSEVRAFNIGVDSMQAVNGAFVAIHSYLMPYASNLTLFGEPYDDMMGLYVVVHDAGRRRRLQAVLDEEDFSNNERVRRLQRIKRK